MLNAFVEAVDKTFSSNRETIFLKEDNQTEEMIKVLSTLLVENNSNSKYKELKKQLNYIKAGFNGEKNVAFELKNSFIPMYVIQDLKIEFDGLAAQIDFLLVTNKYICILETKKLNGNITINSDGDFIRQFVSKEGKVYKTEGMYSPISQNNRHKRILENLLKSKKISGNMPIHSLVVIANPKSIIKYDYTPKAIRNSVIKIDQLTRVLNDLSKSVNISTQSKSYIDKVATKILALNLEKESSFINQFKTTLGVNDKPCTPSKKVEEKANEVVREEKAKTNTQVKETKKTNAIPDQPEESTKPKVKRKTKVAPSIEKIVNEIKDYFRDKEVVKGKAVTTNEKRMLLRLYRTICATDEQVRSYMVFNNLTMEEILEKCPINEEELLNIRGMGPVKVKKYGEQILEITNLN